MNAILDACTLINLINGKVLHKISLLKNCSFFVCDNLINQEILDQTQIIIINALLDQNAFNLFTSDITLSEFQEFKKKYKLGAGETECICLSKKHDFVFASDDKKARDIATKEIGGKFVIGSLTILKQMVLKGILTCEEANISYNLMKEKGGFLPKIIDNSLCE